MKTDREAKCFFKGSGILIILILNLFLLTEMNLMAGTYYTRRSGTINSPAVWNTLPGGGGSSPSDFTGTNTWIIQSGHSMIMNGSWTVGAGGNASVIIEGDLTVSSTYNVSITGILTVNGILTNSGIFAGSSPVTASGGIFVNGTYIHSRDGGYIPTATWADNSNCNITGIVDELPIIPSAAEVYGNFTWNCPGEVYKFYGNLKGNLRTVKGDFNVISTGSFSNIYDDGYIILGQEEAGDLTVYGDLNIIGGKLSMCAGTASRKMTIKGNINVTGGEIYISAFAGTGTIDVEGDLICSGPGSIYFSYNNTTPATINVAGNCAISGGNIIMSYYASASTGIINVAGDFTHTGGTITETTTGGGAIIFNGTGMQTYTSGSGLVSNTINFTVNNGSYLQMAAPETVINGAGTFTLQNGALLGIRSPSGITVNGSGNIQTAARVFSSGAGYIYNGSGSQNAGSGLTQNTPANLTVDNGSVLTLSAATTVSGLLNSSNGTLDLANKNLTVGSLTGSGNITNTSGTPANMTLTVGSDNSSPAAYNGIISNGTSTNVALTKIGSGTLILSNAANTYTGVTTVTEGELRLNPASTTASIASRVVLNGGTLSTTEIMAGAVITSSSDLSLDNSSTIVLGTNQHSLKFTDSHLLTWAGTTLTVIGWSGTAGSGGTAGKIFFGSGANGLTPAQLAKITFYGYGTGAGILSTGEIVPFITPEIVISSENPAVPGNNILQNSINNVIYKFGNSATVTDAVISGLQITTSGTFTAADLVALKAWYSSDETFNPGTDILLSAKTGSLGAGTHVFPDWTNQAITAGIPGYIFVTADVSCDAAIGATIYVEAVTISDVNFISGDKSGIAYPGGLQTTQEGIPENVINLSATTEDSRSVLAWTNPDACPGYDEILIIAREGSAVSVLPSGDGTSYSPDLTYGSGTFYDGGYVIYKGSASPQTVTGLSNGTTYYYTCFTRSGSTWSNGATVHAKAIANSDLVYRTARSGNWGDELTWEIFDGSSWIASTSAPDFNNDQITIRSGHNITVTASVTVDQVTIDSGGTLNVSSGADLTVSDNPAETDFLVNGTLLNSGTFIINGRSDFNNNGILRNSGTVTTNGNLNFNSGSEYEHAMNGGAIPVADWADNSDCNITGIQNTAPLIPAASQPFGNFTWNCTSQADHINLSGQLTTINGNFYFVSTNTSVLRLGYHETGDLTVNGNFLQTGGKFVVAGDPNARKMTIIGDFTFAGGEFYLSPYNGAGTLDVGGNFSSSGSFYFNRFFGNPQGTINVTGNCSINGGTFDMSDRDSNGTLNVAGNFSHTGGKITELSTGSGIGIIVFRGMSIQIYTSGGTVENAINFTVNSGSFLQMATGSTVVSGSSFKLNDGATLGITSPSGITSSGSSGNIQTVTRSFSTGASYVYNGTAAQNTGSGLPSTVNNLTFNIPGGIVTFTGETTVTNNFSVATGSKADLGSFTHNSGRLTLGGFGKSAGTYGSSGSTAPIKDDTYFAISTGVIHNNAPEGTWLGVTTAWNDLENWSGGVVPDGERNVVIDGSVTNQPVISGPGIAACNDLTINPGASLSIDPGQALTVLGTLMNSGTLNLGSDDSGIASLLLTDTAPVQGNNNMELYLTGGGSPSALKWHYISVPLTDGLPVNNIVKDRNDFNLAMYDESVVHDSQNDGWVTYDGYIYKTGLMGGNGFTTMEAGNGYAHYFGEDQLYTITGTLNSDEVSIPLSYNAGGTGSQNIIGFNLVGNPFTCSLDWDVVASENGLTANGDISSAIYSYTVDEAGVNYMVYVPGTPGAGGGTNIIPPMQGFFVKANDYGQILTLPAIAKTHSSTSRFKGTTGTANIPFVRLLLEDGRNHRDAVVWFNEKASLSFDNQYDAYSLSKGTGKMSIWTRLNGADYSINGIPWPETTVEIPVAMHSSAGGTYTIRQQDIYGLEGFSVTLSDKVTKNSVDLQTGGALSFTSGSGMIENRFVLIISDLVTGSESGLKNDSQFTIFELNGLLNIIPLSDNWNGKNGTVRILDLTGRSISLFSEIAFMKNTPVQLLMPAVKGIYFIEVRSGSMKHIDRVLTR